MSTRLAAALVIVTFVALAVASLVGLTTGVDLGRDIYRDRLTSVAESGARDVDAALGGTVVLGEALARSPGAAEAIAAFTEGFTDLPVDDPDFDLSAEARALVDAYEEPYLQSPTGRTLPIDQVVSENPGAVYLQTRYSIADTVLDDPGNVNDAGDGSSWSETHRVFHPGYRRVAESPGLTDLYLVDGATSRVVYSADKRPDLGTSLTTGPFSGSILANTVDAVVEDPSGGAVLSDLGFYDARPGEVVGVIATPVFDDDVFVGVLAVTYDGLAITDVLTDRKQWTGLPPTGDVYLVGANGTTRSDPRPYLVEPNDFLDTVEAAGRLSSAERAVIERLGTTVLTLPAVEDTVRAGIGDESDVEQRNSVTGADVIGTQASVNTGDLGWFVVAEFDTTVAESSIDDFRNILVVGTAVFVILITFFAVGWAASIMRPVKLISERLGAPDGDEPIVIPDQSPIELHHLARSYEDMASTLDRQQVELAQARDARLEVMSSMLPPTIAERIAQGDLDDLDEVERASVAVVVVLGLGELVRSSDIRRSRMLVDRVHEELDRLAEVHGLDRVKVVGDAYFAACGHDRPFIDHAPRVVAFAADARTAIRELATDWAPLDAAVGVHTGRVTVGMTGGSRLLYDVWGDTVTAAHHLARRAGSGGIVLSDATHALLPDEVDQFETDVDGAHAWALSDDGSAVAEEVGG